MDICKHEPEHDGQLFQNGSGQASSDQPTPGPFAVGEIIGGAYKILDYLGQGGMGFVYRVEHLVMARVLALKVLRSDQVSATAWRRFQTEAKAIARLEHTNIVKIYDMNHSESGLPYYTMDLLTGESLADLLQRNGYLPVKEALPIFRQVCAGLAYAHDRGITHRDIKPANIMLLPPTSKTASGAVVKIVDFGIAKLTTLDGSAEQGLTKPGEVFGSPFYMSPEQCSGMAADHRTDIYSLGITLFEALTGRPPFVGRTAVETTMMHQLEEPPSLSEIGEEQFSLELERIVSKLLQKSPADRYQSLAQTASDLLILERSTASVSGMDGIKSQCQKSQTRENSRVNQTDFAAKDDLAQTINLSAGRNKQKLVLVIASLLLIVSLGLVGMFFVHKASAVHVHRSAPETITAESLPIYALYKAEIGENKPLFSTIVENQGNKIRHFEFPKAFSVGSINYLKNGIPTGFSAQGTVEVPAGSDLELVPSGGTIQFPAILKRFQNGDLVIFQNDSIDGTNEMVHCISQITSLRKIEMPANDIDNSCLEDMAKLTGLESLDVSDTKISGLALAKTNLPKQLRNLKFKNNLETSPLLEAMRDSKKVERLSLERDHLSKRDLQNLGTMPNLISLTLGNNNELHDSDLQPLLQLRNLKTLDLRRCQALTPAAHAILKHMPHLARLYLILEEFEFLSPLQ